VDMRSTWEEPVHVSLNLAVGVTCKFALLGSGF